MGALVPIVTKVERLIALTASDYEEEARTSALIACRLIRSHGLHVVADELPSWQPPRKPDYRTGDASEPRTITTKFDCVCLDCHTEIYAGERCVWLKGKGCWHTWCAP